ncbi:MAG TPA: cytochrome c oxidase subunit II [Candidatus Acidoferrum sp.]|nr:cytochrome c oxidase subunit II [Candidatus Acidoferrum sp.]
MTGLIQSGLHLAAAVALVPIRPPAASTIAENVDRLHFTLTAITLFFTVVIFLCIFFFMIKYRRQSDDDQPEQIEGSLPLELTWTIIPAVICVGLFIWSSALYVRNSRPPAASTEIFVIGKQWMWHVQHPEGPREIDEMHVPVNEPIKLTMTSQDVIHDFYIPAFRVKKDVLPGRYTSLWFQATKVGTYHLFCAQYCGAEHSEMIGWVYVMTPTDYAAWLAGAAKTESMASAGERLFTQLGCGSCHATDNTGRAPSLLGIYGKPETLKDGSTRIVDEALMREAIVNPNSVLLPKYPPIMPTFKGQVDEEQVLQLIAYVKSLGTQERTASK